MPKNNPLSHYFNCNQEVRSGLTIGSTTHFDLADGTRVIVCRNTPEPAPVKRRVRKPKAVAVVVVSVPTHRVAYFAYPDSTGRGSVSHRRVIIHEVTRKLVRGYETSNRADYQFKNFTIGRVSGLGVQVVDEPVTAEDIDNIPGYFEKYA